MYFIDLRATGIGGIAAEEAAVYWEDGSIRSPQDFARDVQARDVVLATHGFNVNREHGRNSLTFWGERCELPSGYMLVGILWPGDSAFFPILDYPVEGQEAIKSGRVLAKFVNQYATGAQSLSLVSHSLGARMVLQALDGLNPNPGVRRLILMAGAIEDDCLVNEYARAALKAQEIYILASREDWVLKFAFPIGNPVGQIIMHGHPYFRTAIGRAGPASFDARTRLWQIPDGWNYGHLDYLPGDATGPLLPPPLARPGDGDPTPTPSTQGWKPSWSAGAVSTQVV